MTPAERFEEALQRQTSAHDVACRKAKVYPGEGRGHDDWAYLKAREAYDAATESLRSAHAACVEEAKRGKEGE